MTDRKSIVSDEIKERAIDAYRTTIPILESPIEAMLAALEAVAPLLRAEGMEHSAKIADRYAKAWQDTEHEQTPYHWASAIAAAIRAELEQQK